MLLCAGLQGQVLGARLPDGGGRAGPAGGTQPREASEHKSNVLRTRPHDPSCGWWIGEEGTERPCGTGSVRGPEGLIGAVRRGREARGELRENWPDLPTDCRGERNDKDGLWL